MTVCVIYYHLGLGHPQREAMTQTHRQMDMATYRLNQPRGQFRGKSQTIPHMMDVSLALQHRHGLRPASVNIFIFQIPQKVLRICQLSVCCVSVCCVQADWLSPHTCTNTTGCHLTHAQTAPGHLQSDHLVGLIPAFKMPAFYTCYINQSPVHFLS